MPGTSGRIVGTDRDDVRDRQSIPLFDRETGRQTIVKSWPVVNMDFGCVMYGLLSNV